MSEMTDGEIALSVLRVLLRRLASKGLLDVQDATTLTGGAMQFASDTGDRRAADIIDGLEKLIYETALRASGDEASIDPDGR